MSAAIASHERSLMHAASWKAPSAGLVAHGRIQISDAEFRLFQRLVEVESGIQLPESKRLLLVGRLARRVRTLGLPSFGAYYRVATTDPAELVHMIDLISTNETHFFRDPRQFEFIEEVLAPRWLKRASSSHRRIRVWSAASSTGQEPYSIAMSLLAALPGWEVEVCATDISTRVLEAAEAAVWPIEKSREVPERYLKRFMLRGTGDQQGYMKAGPALRSCVRFERANLLKGPLPFEGPFDLVFCRNVLIYFAPEGRAAVLNRLLGRLNPGGFLFLGHAETLHGVSTRMTNLGPAVYRLDSPVSGDIPKGVGSEPARHACGLRLS